MSIVLYLVLACVIAVLTLMPVPPGTGGFPGLDKLAHFVAFGVLAMPLSWRYPRFWGGIALLTLAYGGLIEMVQPLTGRQAEWGDLLANAAGAVGGAWAAARLAVRREAGAERYETEPTL